ncbi:replication-relaxation family protein [Paractinoplanes rishiriensis]|uniref:Uncharacterized protein n=1 Tax=Paractinoplanes rishiriensis TaxID=1050105 RepID=A0A919K6A3_9ACTN|nr:replication-relaxation family protein [Actinoplanes rishiriensis]GIE99499.1 hypothetical protein Ari01nite_69640 [Actinoplanes rishiriensis]
MARARVDRAHPVNVLAAIERLTETDLQVLRLVAEHEVMSTEQLAALCFANPARVADAVVRLDYLATRAMLVKFGHPGTHPAGVPADDLSNRAPAGLPTPVPGRWGDGRRWSWSLGQGGAYWAGVERILNSDRWVDAWSRSFVPLARPHLRRRLALGDFFTALHHRAVGRQYARLDQWWGPARCADTSGGKTRPDAHGRWRYGTATVPFWIYSDSVRQPTRTLITTVERHLNTHPATAESDVILLVMVNDHRERALHRRWPELTEGAALPPVATTSYRKLRLWPAEGIWRPLTGRDALSVPLHRLARHTAPHDPRFGDPGAFPDRPSALPMDLGTTRPRDVDTP